MSMTLQQAVQSFSGPRTYTANGTTRRTSAWEDYLRKNNLLGSSSGIGTVAPGTPAPTPIGTAPVTVKPIVPVPTMHADPIAQPGQPATGIAPAAPITPPIAAPPAPPKPMAPSWIQNLFPTIGTGGLTTQGLGTLNTWNPNWQQQIDEWKAASAVDPNYAAAYSAALMEAMQSIAPLQSEVAGLVAHDPHTGMTRYQDAQQRADLDNARAVSHVLGNAAARGLIGQSGAVNSNLTSQAAAYLPVVKQLQETLGDARLAAIGQQVGNRLLGLNMGLVNAYQQAAGNAIANLPTIPAFQGAA